MRYSEWIKLAKQFKRYDFDASPLNDAVQTYMKTWQEGDLMTLASIVNSAQANFDDPVITQLKDWVAAEQEKLVQYEQGQCGRRLREAADIIVKAYELYLEPSYLAAVQMTFIKPPGHAYCYFYFPDPMDWTDRVLETGSNSKDQPNAMAETPPGNVHYNMPSWNAPYDRRIDFTPQAERHTLVHEMLHWVCHETFRNTLATKTNPADILAVEGFTEYLARKALNEWDKGGYTAEMRDVQPCINKGTPKLEDVLAAYFKGVNVRPVADELIREVAGKKKADTGTVTRRDLEYIQGQITGRLTKKKWADPDTVKKDMPMMYNMVVVACTGLDHATVLGYTSQLWADYLLKENKITS
jgi:hypothetical protein